MLSDKVVKNRFGFYSLREIPSKEQLSSYYQEKYYQESNAGYQNEYSQDEIEYLTNKIEQKFQLIESLIQIGSTVKPCLLDIGCGEGWVLKFFTGKEWEVLGLDYSKFGCEKHNPECLEQVILGDLEKNIETLISENRRYHVIFLDNVLEHVTDPLALLQNCYKLLDDNGVLMVEVPNDFSRVQEHLINGGYVSSPYWVAIPDHISYFNREGLQNICREAGFACECCIGDFPIEFNLFNDVTNYTRDKSVGKACHRNRVLLENFLHGISVDKVNQLYGVMAEMGLGRQIVGFFQKENTDG